MKKQLTVEEKVAALTAAIRKADAKLDWTLQTSPAHKRSEWALTTIQHVRRILQRALDKVEAGEKPGKTNRNEVKP